jgi:hypothetical protein
MFVFTDINMEPGSGTKQNRNKKKRWNLDREDSKIQIEKTRNRCPVPCPFVPAATRPADAPKSPRQPPQEMDDAELASTSQTAYHLVA